MRYQLRAVVESDSFAAHPINIETPDFKITFETQAPEPGLGSGELCVRSTNYLTISTKILGYERYLHKLEVNGEGRGRHVLTAGPTPPEKDQMIGMLRYIESMGSFWLSIEKIDFNGIEEKWLPDSEEERSKLGVVGVSLRAEYKNTIEQIDPLALARVVAKKKDFDYLTIPLAFFRLGKTEYKNFSYYLAYLSFYLFLDGLFGGGHHKSHQVVAAFGKNVVLRMAIKGAIDLLGQEEYNLKRREIEAFFAKKHKKLGDVDQVIEFLVGTRGELAHFSLQDTRDRTHVLNEHSFQPVAFLIMAVCIKVIVRVANEPEFRADIAPASPS